MSEQIKFTDEMKILIRDGLKTQTRRVVKPQWPITMNLARFDGEFLNRYGMQRDDDSINCPYKIGESLRVSPELKILITDLRVERLQDMGKYDAEHEGTWGWAGYPDWWGAHEDGGICPKYKAERCLQEFPKLWDSIYAETHPWKSNPLVWVIGFEALA